MNAPAKPENGSRPGSLGIPISTLALGLFMAAAWSSIGASHPAFAMVANIGLLLWGLFVGKPLATVAPARFTVSAHEDRTYRTLGVTAFNALLRAISWNRAVAQMRGFDGTRSSLAALDAGTRESETAHGFATVLALVLALAALATGHAWGALWIALLMIPLHLYPWMLQRHVRYRLQLLSPGLS